MDIIVNDNRIPIPIQVNTWGDLLDWLETDYLKAGQCITRVYLGESESLNYREGSLRKQDIAVIGTIGVESGNFDTVVRESMAELNQELKNTIASSGEIIRLLENRKEQEAYSQLAELLDSIRIFVAIFSEDLGWTAGPRAEISPQELSAALERALTQLIAAQENGYWVSICDVLEYEITPILESWQKLVERTRERIN